MTSSTVCCVVGVTVWRVLAVAGVVLIVLLPPPPPESQNNVQQQRTCSTKLSSIARRIIHQVCNHNNHIDL